MKEHKHSNSDQHNQSKEKKHTGHHNHHKMMIQDFKKRFFIVLTLTIPILLLSPTIQTWLSLNIDFAGDNYILLGLSTFVFFYGGWPFLKGSYKEIFHTTIGMMTLISLAITVAYLYSSATVFGLEGKDFFWELVTLILIMLLGHWIEMKSVMKASSALDELAKLIPEEAHLVQENDIKEVQLDQVQKNDIVLVKPGERVPLDGIIVEGESHIDESILTGESKPVLKKEQDKVIAGSINGNQVIRVKITHETNDSFVSNVIKIVQDAQNAKSKTQNFTDKAAFYLTIVAISVGIITFAVWYVISGDLAFSITRMATVMIITCPHALGLAIPLVVANSTTLAAKNGLIIRNRTAFENSRNISIMVFDKTGTLTEGKFAISDFGSINKNKSDEEYLHIAGSIETMSEHPIATAFGNTLEEKNLKPMNVTNFEAIQGKGVKGTVNEQTYFVVSERFVLDNNISKLDDEIFNTTGTKSFLVNNDELIAYFILKDQLRSTSKEAIQSLQSKGIQCWVLTGDNEHVAKEVADELQLDGFYAEVLPDDKQEKIKELQSDNNVVAMTGDGVNDAPALAQADIGIAVGSGTDVAVESADIILANSNPLDIVNLTHFGVKTYQKMIQNLIWATLYNVIAIPLAAGIFYNQGIIISPAVGAIFMSLSTVIVAINAKLLSFNS